MKISQWLKITYSKSDLAQQKEMARQYAEEKLSQEVCYRCKKSFPAGSLRSKVYGWRKFANGPEDLHWFCNRCFYLDYVDMIIMAFGLFIIIAIGFSILFFLLVKNLS